MSIFTKRLIQRVESKVDEEVARVDSCLPQRICSLHTHTPSDDHKHETEYHRREDAKRQMVSNGWCPHQVNRLSKTYNTDTFLYLATLEPSSYRVVDHTRCSRLTACIAFNTNPSNYTTRHVMDGCVCSTVYTPFSALVKVIRDGGIPLLSIEDVTGAVPAYNLRVHRRHRKSMYIAISHVWADGLGNSNHNGLPFCQIKRLRTSLAALHKLLSQSNGEVLFWMDTLCIPVGKNYNSLRLPQIDKMASIYKGATCSLVLDTELMSTRSGIESLPTRLHEGNQNNSAKISTTLSPEARARIACSVWMSRCWTYQEGELPGRIAVQFQQGAVVLGRASKMDRTYKERFTITRGGSEDLINVSLSETGNAEGLRPQILPAWRENSHSSGPLTAQCECIDIDLQRALYTRLFRGNNKFATVWNELAGRSTTMPRDVPIIISNILDLDNRDLLTYKSPGEMFQAIMLSLKQLPLSIFFNFGPRQQPDGNHQNRWVPTQVSTDTLTSDESLEIQSSHLLYKHVPNQAVSGYSVFTIDRILAWGSGSHLHFECGDILYEVRRPSFDTDQIQISALTSTCVIIENEVSHERPGAKRGACFYFRNSDQVDFYRIAEVDMTFGCPIRIQRAVVGDLSSELRECITALEPVRHECFFRINYDPIPGFKPLKRRANHDLRSPMFLIYSAVLSVCLILVAAFFLREMVESATRTSGGISFGLLFGYICVFMIGFIALTILAEILLVYLVPAWVSWRYIRSFEAMAAKRAQEETV